MKPVRVRLAPSPTGMMHVGTLRVALYDYLLARQTGGSFVLRIEDTDQKREVEGAVKNFTETLQWAGLDIDEGPLQGGDFGPYIQSERLDIYRERVQFLLDNGHAYWCACSSEELDQVRLYQQEHGLKVGYNGACRDKGLSEGSVVRLRVPKEGETVFDDAIRGRISIPNADVDDQVLLKSDGFPTYHLAVVVDDHMMDISHVLRGEEWISSTPKHILLYQAFEWEPPVHAHLPLLLNPDKTKLSKRQGDVSVEDYIRRGYLPQAMINFIALQGWNPKGDQELYTMDDLINFFDLEKVNASGSVVNWEKLDWMQGQYVKQLDDAQLCKYVKPFLTHDVSDEQLLKIVGMIKDRLTAFSGINDEIGFIFDLPDYEPDLLVWKKSDALKAREVLSHLLVVLDQDVYKSKNMCEDLVVHWIAEHAYSNGDVLWPLRTALSGLQHSPPPFDIMYVLGCDEVLRRLQIAVKKLS